MTSSMPSGFKSLLISGLGLVLGLPAMADEPCTYSDWTWDVRQKKAVNFRTVQTTKDQLSSEHVHPELPCSICQEDMAEIHIGDLEPVLMCRVVAGAVEDALNTARDQGFPIETLTGYRVGRTKGAVDERGLRTEYSHHSFGLAIDINAETNGLYDNCFSFSPRCRLRRGGPWSPDKTTSITPASPLYKTMKRTGFLWGGELYGQQKDFMHFSLSGD